MSESTYAYKISTAFLRACHVRIAYDLHTSPNIAYTKGIFTLIIVDNEAYMMKSQIHFIHLSLRIYVI